jgi:hypothetical protein
MLLWVPLAAATLTLAVSVWTSIALVIIFTAVVSFAWATK